MPLLLRTAALLIGCLALCAEARIKNLSVSPGGKAGFSAIPIAFTNLLARERSITNSILLNGSGVAAGDVNGDGLSDVYFCGLDSGNKLFLNRGDWKFEPTSEAACEGLDSTGAAFADIDKDGDLDLIVNTIRSGTRVFLNDGKGGFAPQPGAPLNAGRGAMSLALADIDGDGDLDLYVTNYRASALMDMGDVTFNFKTVSGQRVIDTVNGRPVTDAAFTNRFHLNAQGRVEEVGEADVLYLNNSGRFEPVSWTGGAFLDEAGEPLKAPTFDWGLTVLFRDLNQDGRPDIYVCNDFDSPDRVWINQGGGRFKALEQSALRHTSLFSMGADIADINRDGHDDMFVLDMLSRDHRQRMTTLPDTGSAHNRPGQRPQHMMNTLQLNQGNGRFLEIAQYAGVHAAEWAWGAVFLDVDLDGFEDILITNGNEADARNMDVAEKIRQERTSRQLTFAERMNLRRQWPRLDTPNIAFRNRGDLTFEDASAAWGFNARDISYGLCLADFDNDGDMDVAMNNLNSPATLLRNETSAPRVAVRAPVGARIEVTGGPVAQSQEIIAGGRYLSGDQLQRTFAAVGKVQVAVKFPSGKQATASVAGNTLIEFNEADATDVIAARAQRTALFEDASDLLGHYHSDAPFDDFTREPLLPRRMSNLTPALLTTDLDDDGWPDLVITSGGGGQLAAFRNLNGERFEQLWKNNATRDQIGIAANFLAISNFEDGIPGGAVIRRLDLKTGLGDELIGGDTNSCGAIAVGDVNGDGKLDILRGNRAIPGKYPLTPNSSIYVSKGEDYVEFKLPELGLVTAAIFANVIGDETPDLIVACEWGSLRIFEIDNRKFTERTDASGLAQLKGWWSSLASADLDGDGRAEIIAGNWGRNSRYQPTLEHPERLYYLDWDNDGAYEILEAHYDFAQNKYVPWRGLDAVGKALPFVREKVATHAAFAQASVEELLAGHTFKTLEVNTAATIVFWNRGEKFEGRPLPAQAQFAPVYGIAPADFDGDKHIDLFLSQGFLGCPSDVPRHDGGAGLLMLNDGKGNFRALTPEESGIWCDGEQRACAAVDFNRDQKMDLVVTQNRGQTKLYRKK